MEGLKVVGFTFNQIDIGRGSWDVEVEEVVPGLLT